MSFLSPVLDGSTDVSNLHFLTVHLVTIENFMPIHYFYGFLEIKDDESAAAQAQLLYNKFVKDDIVGVIKRRIVAMTTDGAAGK